jgi:hypothetical protein
VNDDFDCKLAGITMALLCGMDGEARESVTEALKTFADDRRTPISEATFYRGLAASIELPTAPRGLLEDLFTTVSVH